jgi:N-acetylglucosaminyldiphosphoundecaprenol N-acetyl-beta-D-mannosaminyltransferase
MTVRLNLFGVPIDALTMDASVARCRELILARRPAQHAVLNAAKVVQMMDDPGLRDAIRRADVVNADGMAVVWAGRLMGVPLPERVTGIDLMERLLAEAEHEGWPTYFLGARPDVLDAFVDVVRRRHPKLPIAGMRDGYFDDDAAVARDIRASGARLLFVGMSSPRKERFLARQLRNVGDLLAVGVGGAFDVGAGRTRRAPPWMQRAGLEWAFRLAQEPRRMAGRYLVGNVRFVWCVVRARAGARSC